MFGTPTASLSAAVWALSTQTLEANAGVDNGVLTSRSLVPGVILELCNGWSL